MLLHLSIGLLASAVAIATLPAEAQVSITTLTIRPLRNTTKELECYLPGVTCLSKPETPGDVQPDADTEKCTEAPD